MNCIALCVRESGHIYLNLHLLNGYIWLPQNFSRKRNILNTTEFFRIPRNELILPPLQRKIKKKEMHLNKINMGFLTQKEKYTFFLRENSPYRSMHKEPIAVLSLAVKSDMCGNVSVLIELTMTYSI